MATKRRVASVQKDAAPLQTTTSTDPIEVEIDVAKGHLGVTLSDADLFAISGVRIDHVDPADLFAEAGLVVGDVITEVNGQGVKRHKDALAAMDRAKGKVRITYLTKAAAEKADLARVDVWGRRGKMGVYAVAVVWALVLVLSALHFTSNVPGAIDGTFHTLPTWLRFRKRYILWFQDKRLFNIIQTLHATSPWKDVGAHGIPCEKWITNHGHFDRYKMKPHDIVTWCTEGGWSGPW
jgi:hypothetical protein